ncbi:MAG: pyridoxine 4-dehydrogenase [Solirubrobacteraceae bacterium]|jgi:pyridoxine 4-dehydrogenase|nr:pyridoxine 4-dehydrogenase [Solirubrobacteraceae bacterium]
MQLPGPGVFGPPPDRDAALGVLRRAIELGVNHVDTAQYYGPDVANELIHDALHPYPPDLVLVSKVGAGRDAQGGWHPASSPAELRAGVEDNLRSLEVDRIDVVNLRLTNGSGPFDEQLDAMVAMRDEGLIGGIGLSNISLEQFEQGVARTEIACVQNALNVVERAALPLLERCRSASVPFVPFFPLGSAFDSRKRVLEHPAVRATAKRLGALPSQVALAWLLALAPNILLIPGTSSRQHLEENLAAADLVLDEEALALLDA